MLESVRQDVKFAVRTLRRSPGYTAVALLTLLLGIGANTAVFSVVNGVLLRPLPYPEPDRLVRVTEVNGEGREMNAAWRNFLDWRERAGTFEGLVAHGSGTGSVSVVTEAGAERARLAPVSRDFFRTLGVTPAPGRDFFAAEHTEGAVPVVVVSRSFWETRLGARAVDGLRIRADGRDLEVVGIAPAGFTYPGETELWVPLEVNPQSTSRTSHNYRVLGRLAAGVSIRQADTELDNITASFLEAEPEAANQEGFRSFWPAETRVVTLHEATVGNVRRPLVILLGAAALVLLVACTNLASTTLARGTARAREFAVRLSLGAGRTRVVRQLFTESLVLALLGAVGGAALAAWLVRLLPAFAPEGVPRLDEVRVDGTVLGVTVLAAVVTAVLSGLLPAFRGTGRGLAGTLRSGGRAGEGVREQRIWRALVSLEVALALTLLVGSGLLLRSFWSVLTVDPGYRTENLLTISISPPAGAYPDGAARTRYFQEVLAAIRDVRGVESAALASGAPMDGVANGLVDVRGSERASYSGEYQLVSPDYFAVMGIPVLRGRVFDGNERPEGEHVVVVNRAFADAVWPDEDPVGRQMTAGGMDEYWSDRRWATVIGVVGDVRQDDLTRPAAPTYYFPLGQRLQRTFTLAAVIRPAIGNASTLAPALQDAIRRVDPEVPLTFRTVEERLGSSLAARRFTMTILLVFAAVALLLACVGIYGVVAYAVERRTKEIGIRVALGAEPGAVRRMVRRSFMRATALGMFAGGAAALWLTRLMASLLYDVAPTDPLTFAGVAALLAGAAWLASYVPSLRASRISPMQTMRSD